MSKGSMSLAQDVYSWIYDNIKENSSILELGSGDSTDILSQKYIVTSIEENSQFVNRCKQAKYIYAPIIDDWYAVEPIKYLKDHNFDLIIIDGPAYGNRLNMLKYADLFNSQFYLFDDTDRPNDLNLAEQFAVIKKLKIKKTPNYCVVF